MRERNNLLEAGAAGGRGAASRGQLRHHRAPVRLQGVRDLVHSVRSRLQPESEYTFNTK